MKPNFDKYISVPFKYRGRDLKGCDCFGLVRLIYKNERNIVLPDYLDINYSLHLSKNNETYIEDKVDYHLQHNWESATLPYQRWDILIFYTNPKRVIADHMGLYIGDNKFIHTSDTYAESIISRLDWLWESRIYGGLRYFGTS